jgi:hypothetical protein
MVLVAAASLTSCTIQQEPMGFGMMEIHGLNSEMIDVACYTQKAFEDASQMAGVMGETDVQSNHQQIAQRFKQQINDRF